MSDGDRPNILVIWGDDIGITNLSCYSDGLMGYRTPNIDRIAEEGMRFTDSYGEQSWGVGFRNLIGRSEQQGCGPSDSPPMALSFLYLMTRQLLSVLLGGLKNEHAKDIRDRRASPPTRGVASPSQPARVLPADRALLADAGRSALLHLL